MTVPASDPVSVADYERLAQQRLPHAVYEFVAGGVAEELTLRANRAAFEAVRLCPQALVDVSHLDTRVTLFGRELAYPVLLAPTAYHRAIHPEGELATARGAKTAGVAYVVSCVSTTSIEEIRRENDGALWFQLYLFRDRGLTREIMQRAEAAGCDALCVTIDQPTTGVRDRERRAGFSLPPGARRAHLEKLGDVAGQLARAATGDRNIYHALYDPAFGWPDVERLIAATRLPVLLKGVINPDDAEKGIGVGAAGIVVSNHGGLYGRWAARVTRRTASRGRARGRSRARAHRRRHQTWHRRCHCPGSRRAGGDDRSPLSVWPRRGRSRRRGEGRRPAAAGARDRDGAARAEPLVRPGSIGVVGARIVAWRMSRCALESYPGSRCSISSPARPSNGYCDQRRLDTQGGQSGKAETLLAQAQAAARGVGDPTLHATLECALAWQASEKGSGDVALRKLDQALARLDAAVDRETAKSARAECLFARGQVRFTRGDAGASTADLRQALTTLGDPRTDQHTLAIRSRSTLALALHKVGQPSAAIGEYERVVGELETMCRGGTQLVAALYNNLGVLLNASGQTLRAQRASERAFEIVRGTGAADPVLECLLAHEHDVPHRAVSRWRVDPSFNRFDDGAGGLVVHALTRWER